MSGNRRVKPKRLGIEPLEARSLLTAAPTLSPAQVAAESTAGNSIDAFGLDLYKELQSAAGGSGNMFVSPFSIATALAMAYAGARGETATQMADALHLSGNQASIADQFGTLLADLNSAGQENYALSVADALWGQAGLPLLPQFLNTMQTNYGGGLKQVDFKGDLEGSRKTINDWVAQNTNNKIQDLLSQLDPATRLVLTNAIYFKGNWASPFNSYDTQDANFTLASGSSEMVSTMHDTRYSEYMNSDGFQVVEIPYAGYRLAMDVILPTTGGAAGLGVSQLPSDLKGWLNGLQYQHVAISLPKFTLTTEFNLNEQLKSLGMTDAFGNQADFSGITDSTQLQVSKVVHKAYIGVDETGTEAAASTGLIMTSVLNAYEPPPPPPIEFNADHPFLFLIRDTQTGSVLFMGQEADPLTKGGDTSAPGIDASGLTQQPAKPPAAVMSNPPTQAAPTLDVDHDSQITWNDAEIVLNYLVEQSYSIAMHGNATSFNQPSDQELAAMDVDHDGAISAHDALLVINGLHVKPIVSTIIGPMPWHPAQSQQQINSALSLGQNSAAPLGPRQPAAAPFILQTITTPYPLGLDSGSEVTNVHALNTGTVLKFVTAPSSGEDDSNSSPPT
jgi:serine protease inhibitor